jgi:hypothetical protein
MSLNREAAPGAPGAGYQKTNNRDITSEQSERVVDSKAGHAGQHGSDSAQ